MDESSLPDAPDALFTDFAPVSDAEWLSKIRSDLRGGDPDALLTWNSLEGIHPRAYYRTSDRDTVPHRSAVPIATSAVAPANAWRIRMDVAHPDLNAARQQLHDALDADVLDLGLAPRTEDGQRGLPLHRASDLERLLDDVDLTKAAIHCTGGVAAPPLWAMLRHLALQRDMTVSELQGSTDFDPVAALSRHHMSGADRALQLAADLVRSASDTPSARLLSIDLRPYHEAGASAVQEIGTALGALSETLVQLRERGVAPQAVASTLQWIVPVDTSYFVAIAKLRALRLLIPQVFGPFGVDVEPTAPVIQAVTSRRSETRYGPYVNLLRGTTEAASAVIGGCDVLTVRPFSAAFAPPSDFAQRLARNTQHILHAESHLNHVADPAAGSYYIERMTDQLAQNAWSFFQTIESDGGLLDALRDGTVQQHIADVRTQRMDRVANQEQVFVGTNHYPDPGEQRPPSEPDLADAPPLERSDRSIDWPAGTTLSALQEAVSERATLGDMLEALRGSGTPALHALPSVRLAEPFEALRLRTAQWAEEHNGPPHVVVLPMGDPAMGSARATFARNVLGVAGFAIDEHIPFNTPEAAAREAAEASADIVVLCSANEAYPELAPALCNALAEAGIDPLVLIAGHLPEHQDDLEAAGVDGFIHADRPLLDTLEDVQQQLGLLSDTAKRGGDES